MNAPTQRPSRFLYSPMFPLGPDRTTWKRLPIEGVRTATCDGQDRAADRPRGAE